jgi:hypothetical protein
MKAEELRIGNCVNYFNDGEHSLIRILDWGYAHLNDASSIDYELLKPIPLTEEWLLKFGLNSSDYITLDKEECILIDIHQNTVWIGNKKAFQYAVGVYIKHLHQLQNLYYALTQKELKYEG